MNCKTLEELVSHVISDTLTYSMFSLTASLTLICSNLPEFKRSKDRIDSKNEQQKEIVCSIAL